MALAPTKPAVQPPAPSNTKTPAPKTPAPKTPAAAAKAPVTKTKKKVVVATMAPATKSTPKQKAAAAKSLNAYSFANGNMSPERRQTIVAPALERLGYTPDQARQIAMATPLNASTYNEEAVISALRFAKSITPGAVQAAGGQPPSTVGAAMTPNPMDMPKPAEKALEEAELKNNPTKQAKKFIWDKAGSRWRTLANRIQPRLDRMANAPIPGGLGGLFAVNLLFLCVVVPANAQGYTRMQLLWYTLMNQTDFPGLVHEEQVIPNSGLVQAGMDIAASIETVAEAVGAITGAAGGVAKVIESGGHAVESGAFNAAKGIINAPIIGGLIQGKGPFGLSYNVPNTSSSGGPPPPPPPPATAGGSNNIVSS